MTRRRRVLLLCGGRSEEHEVSLASARSVLEATAGSPALEVVPLVVGRDGAALSPARSRAVLGDASTAALEGFAAPDGPLSSRLADYRGSFDVVFPLLHGPYGEDGTVQGLLKVMGLPFVGSDVLGSAVSMDKLAMKAMFAAAGLPQVRFQAVARHEFEMAAPRVAERLSRLGLPVFVKPANLGSSIGVSRVENEADLPAALSAALALDRRAIVEASAAGARELELGVLGNDEPVVSGVGEVRVRQPGGFYDYRSKYTDGHADLIVPADLPPEVERTAREMAARAFAAVDAAGLARVDLFYLPGGELLVNEINTMPGFTRHSMFPLLWQAAGVPYDALVERLVDLALERFAA